MRQVVFQLTWLDLFLIALALLSLFGNLFQFMIWWRDRKNLYRPLSSTLIGLFNDIKRKASHAFLVQNTLFQQNNPHTDITTLRWEYAAYTQTVWNYLQGFQETVVAVLVSMNPSDREGKEAFRATDYGLTEDEKRQQKESLERFRRQQAGEASPETPADAPQPDEPTTV